MKDALDGGPSGAMTIRPSIFPTFFLSGFECSTFVWKSDGRRDLSAELQHYEHADNDYAMLGPIGIAVAREGIPWPLVDRGGDGFDFSCLDPFLAAQRRHRILPIWDLCHYGYPDDLDPLSETFVIRFAAYARAAARYVAERAHHGPLLFTPMNEPTFWGYMGGEWGWCAPFGRDRDYRVRRDDITVSHFVDRPVAPMRDYLVRRPAEVIFGPSPLRLIPPDSVALSGAGEGVDGAL